MPAPHPTEFRRRAVELARRGDTPQAQLAKDLGISRSCPLARFGSLWSESILRGTEHLEKIPAGRRMSLRYEDLIARPVPELTRLAEFLGVRPDPRWLHAGAEMLVDRRGAATRLAADELSALRESCAPGTAMLREAGSSR